VTTHAGPFVTLPAAYAAIFPRVTQLPQHQLIGLPAVEIYQTARVNARLQLNVTDICLPVAGSGSGLPSRLSQVDQEVTPVVAGRAGTDMEFFR
jgi:hypothetical protein